jgi:hypothetical protein
MDANEYARKVAPAEKSLALALRQATWMGKGKRARVDVPGPITPPPPADEREPEVLNDLAGDVAPEVTVDHPSLAASSSLPSLSPPSATSPVDVTTTSEEIVFQIGERRWRVRGLDKNLSPQSLRVNLLVNNPDGLFFVDTLEMYSARQRALFVREAHGELGVDEAVLKREVGDVLLKLEAMQEEQIKKALAPKDGKKALSEDERVAALALLRDPKLIERIVRDFDRCGVVGEHTNKLLGYLAATSRKLEEPLAVVIQSSSAAGKSSLMEAVLRFVPEEERVQYSAMTGQSLFYMGEEDLKHKVLAVSEEEGAERASYALKLLQSEGELTIASTGKDPQTGKLVTHAYRVEGPVMIFLTTTAIEVDEELLNRCLVLTVDEGREQTRAIHARQRRAQTLAGLLDRQEKKQLERLHRDAQRLLRPLYVVNPFAEELSFVDTRTRTRRDHMKYLTLIRAVALLHQYQREVKTVEHAGQKLPYVEVTRADIEVATRLAHEVLGRSLDELPPVTRRLLHILEEMVTERAKKEGVRREDVRFTRREVREHTGWGNTQLKVHLGRLDELEYVVAHRAGRGAGTAYELRYAGEGKDGGRFVVGLGYDIERSGLQEEESGFARPAVGAESGMVGMHMTNLSHRESPRDVRIGQDEPADARRGRDDDDASYVHLPSFAAEDAIAGAVGE